MRPARSWALAALRVSPPPSLRLAWKVMLCREPSQARISPTCLSGHCRSVWADQRNVFRPGNVSKAEAVTCSADHMASISCTISRTFRAATSALTFTSAPGPSVSSTCWAARIAASTRP